MEENTYTASIRRTSNKSVKFDIIVRPCKHMRTVIINYPGYNGDIHGYNGKYDAISRHMCMRGIGAFVQMPNTLQKNEEYQDSVIADLEAVCEYVLQNASHMCATSEPTLYLMGVSAGASAVAAVASKYAHVKRILLIAPSKSARYTLIKHRISSFTGEVYIAIGANDSVVGPDAGREYSALARQSSKLTHILIPECDHQFRGRRNGMIFSKAPLWAFAGDTTFPLPNNGLVLYD